MLTLDVNGIKHGTKPVQLEPGGTATVEFEPVLVGSRNMKATVTLSPDALAADNTFNFVISPTEPVHVTVVDRGTAGAGLYLARALAVGEAPQVRDGHEAVGNAVGRGPAAQRGDRAERRRRPAVAGAASAAIRRAGRRAVRRGGAAGQLAGGRRSPSGKDRGARSTGRAETPPASARSSTRIRSSSRSARRAAATSRRCPSTSTARSRRRQDAQVLAKFDGTAPAVARAARRQRPRAALGVGARHVLERPADARRLRALHPSVDALPGRVHRAAAVAERGPGARRVDRRPEAGRGAARGADAVWASACRFRTRAPR